MLPQAQNHPKKGVETMLEENEKKEIDSLFEEKDKITKRIDVWEMKL